MAPAARRATAIAALLLASATVVGALGAHGLRPRLPPARYEILQTAVQYQFFHSLGLLALAQLLDRTPGRALQAAASLLVAGIVLFCGSLYLLLAGAPPLFGIATPVGGVALIVAWLWVALTLMRRPNRGS